MTHEVLPKSHGGGPQDRDYRALSLTVQKTAPNYNYGKYVERYQYVTPFLAKCHGQAAACAIVREILLRNKQVTQQGFAC